MADLRTLVEQEMERAGSPTYSFVELTRRRDRRQRNRRIGSVLIAAVITLAGGYLLGRTWLAREPQPADRSRPVFVDIDAEAEWRGMWPQPAVDEARRAQARADAGDPDVTWQLDVEGAADVFAERFATEVLGWEGAKLYSSGPADRRVFRVEVLRCGAEPNTVYPGEPCAPTLSATEHELVVMRFEQPVRHGDRGIWVLTRVTHRAPLFRPIPPARAAVEDLVARFLKARIDGRGAERFLADPARSYGDLLYATSRGSRYVRFEISRLTGPEWESREYLVEFRLVADDGTEVIERENTISPEGVASDVLGRWNDHGTYGLFPVEESPTSAASSRGLSGHGFSPNLPGQLPARWSSEIDADHFFVGSPSRENGVAVIADPLAVLQPCATSPRSPGELVDLLSQHPGLVATTPEPASLGGLSGVRLDLSVADGAELTACSGGWDEVVPILAPPGAADGLHYHPVVYGLHQRERMRIYVLTPPAGGTVAVVIVGGPDLEQTLAEAAPIVERFTFEL